MRTLVAAAATAALACAVVPSLASARAGNSLGFWKVSVTGSLAHHWTDATPYPCDYRGGGSFTASFNGTSAKFLVERNSGLRGRGFLPFRYGGNAPLRGTVTAVDNRVMNPNEANAGPCDGNETSAGDGCISTPMSRRSEVRLETTSRHRLSVDVTYLEVPVAVKRFCYLGELSGWGRFPGGAAALEGKQGDLVGPVLGAARFARRKAFTVSASSAVSYDPKLDPPNSAGTLSTNTDRRARLRFTPVRG